METLGIYSLKIVIFHSYVKLPEGMSTIVNLPNPAAICTGSLEDQKAEAGGIPVFWLCLLSAIIVLKAS